MKAQNSDIKLHLVEPRATEKSYLEQTNRYYVFPVNRNMSKQEIAKMVEKEFSVTVTDVKTLIRKGKKTKFSRGKHAYPGTTYRQDKKYAYVRLKAGDSIKVFGEPEEEKPVQEPAKKADKKAEKAEKGGKENK